LKNIITNNPHELGILLGYDLLSEVHTKWILETWVQKGDIVLQAHRNSYKTTAVTVLACVWWLTLNPDSTILIMRKSNKMASETLQQIVKTFQSDKYKDIYKILTGQSIEITDYNSTRMLYPRKKSLSKEYSVEAFGINTDIVGSHYDIIVADDIVTLRDRLSQAERELTKAKVRELQNIKKIGGKIIVTGTPWHSDDAYSILPPAIKYPLGSVEIKGLDSKRVEEIRSRTTAAMFAINYHLKHIADENRIFSNPKYERWDTDLPSTAWIDPAYSGKNWTAIAFIQTIGDRFIVSGYSWRENITDLYSKISIIAKSRKCGTIYIESNADKGVSAAELGKYWPAVTHKAERENKHIKIISHVKGNWPDIYFDHECQEDFLSQIVDYEEGQEPDDSPDALASLIREVNNKCDISLLAGGDGESEDAEI